MDDPRDLSDGDFLMWAGANPKRWALLPGERREAWLDHLVARMKSTDDEDECAQFWRIASVIARTTQPDGIEAAID